LPEILRSKRLYLLFKHFISHSTNEEIDYFNTPNSPGLYDNLLAAHSPFQVDGNMGFTAAVSEMLLQSHQGNWQEGYQIELLPALPKAWENGKVQGLKARGNITVDIDWENGKLINVKLRAAVDKKCTVRYGEKSVVVDFQKNKILNLNDDLKQL
jgi:alpha-L-fucosidase 2